MQMHDALRQTQGGAAITELAATFAISPAQAEAAMRVVASELGWHLEQRTLSRSGLADLVEALGSAHHVVPEGGKPMPGEAMRAEGEAILDHILGSKERGRALAARIAHATGLGAEIIGSMLPGLAAAATGSFSQRAKSTLAEILGALPPLGSWSRGSPHADLADILRRGCGAGPYGRARLRRVVRRALARAVGFRPRGPVRWYLQFMLIRPASAPLRRLVARLLRAG